MTNSKRLQIEVLEDRNCPAIITTVDFGGNLLIMGTPTSGDLTINVVAPDTYTVQDGPATFGPALAPGDVFIFLQGNQDNTITFGLNGNSLSNNLTINTGAGADQILFPTPGAIRGNLQTTGVNSFTLVSSTISGNVSLFARNENEINSFTFFSSQVGGTFTFAGGNGGNVVTFIGSTVGQRTSLQLGNGFNALNVDATSSLGGDLFYMGGSDVDSVSLSGSIAGSSMFTLGFGTNTFNLFSSGLASRDLFVLGGGGTDNVTIAGSVGGSATFQLGSGMNTLSFIAILPFPNTVSGSGFTYIGGAGSDNVNFDSDASLANVILQLGGGADTLTLGNSAAFNSLFGDFGTGDDDFINLLGFLPTNTRLLNL
ncbi:MAG: hypothetical protein ACFCD0_13575 [Gemmataceae bacterium]